MLLAGAGTAWGGMWVNDSKGWNIQIEKNGSTDWLSSDGFNREDKNGSYKDYTSTELKSFSIKKAWIKASSNDNWQIRYAAIYCRVSKNQTGNFTQKKCKDYGSNVKNASSAYFELDVNYDILKGLEPGTYYLDYYFGIGNDGCDKPYCYAPEYNCNGTNPYCSNCQNCSFYTIKFTVPQPDACVGDRYIAGSSSVFGSNWDAGDSNNKMSCDNTTGYSKTYITNFKSDTNIEFKITDGTWDNSWGNNGSNYNYNVKQGCRSVTIKFNGITGEISVEQEASNACCSAPSGVSIDEAPSTKLCPGDQVTLTASIEAGDVDSYEWSVSGNDWSIKSGKTANSCTFTVGTATGKISLKVNGCNTDVLATDKSIQVKSKLTGSDYTVQASASWNSSGTTPSITPNSGEPTPTTVKYKFNSTTATASTSIPKDVGTYYVYITTDATTDYCAATDLYIGEFKIEKANQSTLSISTSNDNPICGNELTLSTTGGSGDGIVTYEIVSGGTASNASISGNKLTVGGFGTVKVKAKKAGDNHYNESAYSEIKTFTFKTPSTLSWKEIPNGFLVADETIEATFSPEGAGSVTYTSYNEAVIAPNNGKLIAQPNKNGTAKITATPNLNPGYCGATTITQNDVPVKFFNVAGTENLCGDAWNTTANPMTYNNGVWSKTFEAKPADVYEFQISREEWDGNWEDRKKIYSGMGNITCEEIHRTDGGDWYNIEFTTPTKGDITIKFTEGEGSYVEFEPICLTASDVNINAATSDKDQYNYNETATFSIANATIDAEFGTKYSISYQWQKKNGESYENIQGATDQTYNATNLEVGTHKYRVAVTFSYNGIKTCTLTKYSEKTINVICPTPDKPTVEVISHTTNCKESTTKGKVLITNYDSECEYYMGENTSPFDVTVEDNKGYIYFSFDKTDSYQIRAKRKCGSDKSEFSDPSDAFTVNYTDNTPSVKVSILGDNSICAGETTTLTANISDLIGTIKSYSWSPEGGIINDNTYTTPALNETESFNVSLKVVNEGCEKTFTATAYPVTVNPIPTVTLGLSNVGICKGEAINDDLNFLALPEVTNGGVAVWYDSETGGNEITKASLEKPGTYWVAAENSETGCKSPKREKFTTVINELPKYPELGKTSASVCQDNAVVDLGKLANVDAVVWYQNDEEVERPNQVSIDNAGTFTYTAKAVNDAGCVSADGVEFTLIVYAQPTFTAPAATQTKKEVKLTSAAGESTKWSVSPTENVTLTDNGDGTATFVATQEGTYTISASNGVCAQVSHTIKVSDAFYIWVRKPIKGEEAYEQFYHKDQNSSEVMGGMMYYKEYANIPPADGYQDYNKDGRKADLERKDCNGYTWYGYKASEDMVAGNRYFTVHAPNDGKGGKGTAGQYGGYYTHTYATNPGAMTSDIYYTMNENASGVSQGWYITKVSAPYAGPMVHASGSTTLGSNKFAALYVTDCSAKTVKSYQWEYSSTQNGTYDSYSASVSNSSTLYSGDAGTTNNIRPSEAGWYRCKVTYDDTSNATSEAVQVTGTYSHESGSLPVFVVNTNGEGFPVNDCSGTPSKNADKMKAKVSVDVKIYQDGTMVYDRKARMNYRGSSSLNFLKKSYAFCPGKANCVEDKGRQDYVKTEKMNMLNVGSAEDKDWVLYAAAPDPSLMRNRLVFDTYKDMTGKWGVSSRFVKLYVDGTYKGIYVLMDKITNNKKRVNITHADGFIVKFDKTDKADRVGGDDGVLGDEKTFKTTRTGADNLGSYDTSIDQRFEIEYPEKDDYPTGWSAKVNSIKAMFEGFENALEAKDFATVQKYIDYDSWADWFIISEYAKNVDAYRASCIFVYNGDKIEATPLWDQELSFNNQTMVNHGNNDATGLLVTRSSIYEDTFKAPFWFTNKGTDIDNITGGLLSDPCFVQVVKEKWNQYSTGTGPLTADALNTKIGAYTTELGSATDIVFNRNTMDCGSCDNGGCYNGDTGYNGSIQKSSSIEAMTETWFKYRGNNLTTAINKLKGANFSIQILPSEVKTTPWEQAHIAVNVSPEGYHYVLEYTDNNLGGVTNIIIEENGNEMTYRIPRPASWSTGDEDTEGERADIEYGIKATLNVASGTIVCGSQAAPTSTAKIILQDEPNENCDK